jgi:hypothetical protein
LDKLLLPFILLLPPPLPSSSSSGTRNLNGWMTRRMTGWMDEKDHHQGYYISRLVCKPILQAKWSGFFAFGSISNFILVMLIILTNILITTSPSSAQWVPKFPMCSPRVRVRENSPPRLCLWVRERTHLPFALPSNHTLDKFSSQ